MSVILAIVTGLLREFGSVGRANAGITFIYFFMVVFSYGWTPMYVFPSVRTREKFSRRGFSYFIFSRQALYPAEVLSYEARAKGLAFLNIVSQASTLINTFG